MVLDQVGILLTGVIAVWLTQHKRESWRRWGQEAYGRIGSRLNAPAQRLTKGTHNQPVSVVRRGAGSRV